jgi:hypothetical protein
MMYPRYTKEDYEKYLRLGDELKHELNLLIGNLANEKTKGEIYSLMCAYCIQMQILFGIRLKPVVYVKGETNEAIVDVEPRSENDKYALDRLGMAGSDNAHSPPYLRVVK